MTNPFQTGNNYALLLLDIHVEKSYFNSKRRVLDETAPDGEVHSIDKDDEEGSNSGRAIASKV